LQQDQFILPPRVVIRDPQGTQFVIERVLGKGALGAVYLVRERAQADKLFALKEVIHPNAGERASFVFEGQVLTRLHHKALPRVHRVFENDKLMRMYVLMDYIKGEDLEALRNRQPEQCFPLTLVLSLLHPIANALIYLHTQEPPIVHRDIKPANIIIPDGGGEAMLVDFGSAKEYRADAVTSIVAHRSPGYAAPEQYRTGTTPATDIYGLAATVYALLTGVAPIDAPSRIARSWSEGADPLRPANLLKPDIPEGVADVLARGLSVQIADRWQTVEEFWQALLTSSPQHTTSAPWMGLAHPFPGEAQAEDGDMPALSKEQSAPLLNKRAVVRLFTVLVALAAIGLGVFSWLSGLTILLFCCVGLVLLWLGLLFSLR